MTHPDNNSSQHFGIDTNIHIAVVSGVTASVRAERLDATFNSILIANKKDAVVERRRHFYSIP